MRNQLQIFSFNPCFNGSWSERPFDNVNAYNCTGFNPCFNGSWSERAITFLVVTLIVSFNPCFNGSWSESVVIFKLLSYFFVSILVLMEVGLRENVYSKFINKY